MSRRLSRLLRRARRGAGYLTMLLFFILILFFILHIDFLLRNVLFGTYESTYFTFTTSYLFDRHIAILSLAFSIACAAAFAIGYRWIYAHRESVRSDIADLSLPSNLRLTKTIFVAFGIMQVIANLILAWVSGFEYQTMAETLEGSGFIFELRIFLLATLAYITLNVRPRIFWRSADYRVIRIVLALYTISILIVQARSRVFEFAAILIFAYLMWAGDRIRWRYVAILAGALIAPNLIVLGRLGIPEDPQVLVSGLFSFEYGVTLNNFLGAAIERSYVVRGDLTFLKSLWLLIPSPVRTFMDITVVKNEAYEALSNIAAVRNGGYSMLAEMFLNFGWWSTIVFGLMGAAIGWLNRQASRVGYVGMIAAAAPLIFAAFSVAFRNDFGVFLKFIIQAFVVTWILRAMMHDPMLVQSHDPGPAHA